MYLSILYAHSTLTDDHDWYTATLHALEYIEVHSLEETLLYLPVLTHRAYLVVSFGRDGLHSLRVPYYNISIRANTNYTL